MRRLFQSVERALGNLVETNEYLPDRHDAQNKGRRQENLAKIDCERYESSVRLATRDLGVGFRGWAE